MKKRIISLILTLTAALLIPLSVAAADTPPIKLSLDSVSACKGATVSMNVTVSENPGFAAMTPVFTFDKNYISFVIPEEDPENGGYVGINLMTGLEVLYGDLKEGSQQLGFLGKSSSKDVTKTGNLITVFFKVADDAPLGEYNITLSFRYNAVNLDEKVVPAVVTEQGKITVGNHSYGTAYSSNKTSHWHICTVCGAKQPAENHVFDNNCDKNCNVCGYTRTVTHSYGKEYVTDGSSHWLECTVCGNRKNAANHVYDGNCDGDCNVCGHTRTAPHNFSDAWKTDENFHWHECADCGEKKDLNAHTFKDNDCTECGYSKFIYGDVNGDGKVDNSDLIRFKKFLAGQQVVIAVLASDVNVDTKTDNLDLIRLKKYFAGQTVKLGK